MFYDISKDVEDVLDVAVTRVIQALRDAELDFPESCTEANLPYVVASVIDKMYTNGSYKATSDVVGVLEVIKHDILTKGQKQC